MSVQLQQAVSFPMEMLATGWRRHIGCHFSVGHFPQTSPIISGSFVKNDPRLKAFCASSPPCNTMAIMERISARRMLDFAGDTLRRYCRIQMRCAVLHLENIDTWEYQIRLLYLTFWHSCCIRMENAFWHSCCVRMENAVSDILTFSENVTLIWQNLVLGECQILQLDAILGMVWLRLVRSIKWQGSFAEYSLFNRSLLQKWPIIYRSY